MGADCGKEAWRWFSWSAGRYVNCIARDAALSRPCAKCFVVAGQYGYDHCKFACLMSWCREALRGRACAQSHIMPLSRATEGRMVAMCLISLKIGPILRNGDLSQVSECQVLARLGCNLPRREVCSLLSSLQFDAFAGNAWHPKGRAMIPLVQELCSVVFMRCF